MNLKPEKPIFASRWLLYPVNIGLILGLCVYVMKFMVDVFDVFRESVALDSEQLRVLLLGLVDTAMVANLMVMVIQGSHQIFIRKFHEEEENRPQWLDHIDSGILKVKVSLSIAGITLVQMLKDFVNLEHIEWTVALHRIEIHVVCLLSSLLMAIIWRVMHPSGASEKAHS